MRKYVFFLVIAFSAISAQAQSFLEPETQAFFEAQQQEYHDWLKLNDLNKFLEIKDMKVNKDKVTLYLKSTLQSDDSLGVAWGNAEDKAMKEGEIFGEILFKQFIHQFEITADSAELIVQGLSKALFEVKVFYDKASKSIKIDKKIAVTKASGTISIRIEDFKVPIGKKGTVGNITESKLREKIYDYLYKYYSQKGTKYVGKSQWEKTSNNSNHLSFEVANISYEILSDVGFYEFISWDITVSKDADGESFNIKYELKGKWGSGWYMPRSNSFKDMENNETYRYYVERYQQIMKSNIEEYLSK
jgi:hypothetical protein